MRTKFEFLFSIESPHISFVKAEAESEKWIPSYYYSKDNIDTRVIRLRGTKMRTVAALMNEFGAAFQFFDGFGENWLALSDCLTCLDEWMPAEGYVILFTEADSILENEETKHLAALLKTLDEAGHWWSKPVFNNDRFNRPARPFHSLFLLPKGLEDLSIRKFNTAAKTGSIKIRSCPKEL